jgi:hypothetical protein
MGGVTSKFDETDWSKANGGLLAHWEDRRPEDVTIDGLAPTYKFGIYEIVKTSVSQREFQVVDPKNKNLLYITRSVPGTLAWFDVLGPNSIGEYQDLKLRVQTDLRRRTWMVYRYNKPVFEGQRPAPLAVRKGLGQNDKLYKTACITVSWSRYAAVAIRYGPPSLDDVLEIEEGARDEDDGDGDDDDDNDDEEEELEFENNAEGLASPKSSYETNNNFGDHDLDDDEGDDDDDNLEDIMAQAAKIAASRRSIAVEGVITSDTTNNNHSDRTTSSSSSYSSPSKTTINRPQRFKNALTSCSPCHGGATNDSPESSLRNPSSFDNDIMKSLSKRHHGINDYKKKSQQPDDTPSSATKLRQMWKSKSKSLGSRIFFRSTNTNTEDDDDDTKHLTKSERKELRRQKALEQVMEGIIDLGKEKDNPEEESPGAALQCREIYNRLIGTHQSSWVTREEVLEMLRLDEAQYRQDDNKNDDNNNNNNNNTQGEPSSPSANKNPSAEDGRRQNSWFGFGLIPKPSGSAPADDASMATTNTNTNTKEEVESSSSAPGTETPNDNDNNNDNNNGDLREGGGGDGLQSLLEDEPPTSPSPNNNNNNMLTDDEEDLFKPIDDSMPVGLRALLNDDDYALTSPRHRDEEEDEANSSKKKDEEEPLIGYWTWKNTYRVHKMRMHLARNSDLALHVVLAILVNQVRYERNAIAMTV